MDGRVVVRGTRTPESWKGEAWREGAAGRIAWVVGGSSARRSHQGKTQLIDRWAPTHSQSGSPLQASEWRVLRPWPGPLTDPSPPGLAATC